jgi:hypothetical protein
MKPSVVVDTNVMVAANGRCENASQQCVQVCVEAVVHIQSSKRVAFDRGYRIIDEYRQRLSHSGQPGLGDALFKWIWQNQANPDCCEVVEIHARSGSGEDYDEFPDDPALAGFDPSDRKFVAVARVSPLSPPVMNATDSDWWDYREVLARHGVRVEFLCPEQFGSKRNQSTRPRVPRRHRS